MCSSDLGLEHRAEAIPYAAGFGRGIDHAVTGRFVAMYVNDFTLDLGDSGRRGAIELLGRAARAGLVPTHVPLDFVTG